MERSQEYLFWSGDRSDDSQLPEEAIRAILRSTLPGEARAPQWATDWVVEVGLADPRIRADFGSPFLATAMCSLLRSGRPKDSLLLAQKCDLVEFAADLSTEQQAVKSVCYSAIAETFLLGGDLSYAAEAARRALVHSNGQNSLRFRALTLLAATLGMSGEVRTAKEVLREAEEIGSDRDWNGRSWPMLLAQAQIGFWSSDAHRIETVLEAFETGADLDLVDRSVVKFARIRIHLIREEYRQVVAVAATIIRGVDARRVPPALLNQAFSSKALALIHLGDPGGALRVIEGLESPSAHTTCFEMLRAGIYLQLGEPRKALAATEACVRKTSGHSLSSLPSVFLRRAVAHEILGHHSLADSDFSRATHLAAETTGLRAAIGFPKDILETLYWRLAENEPEFRPELLRRLPSQVEYPDRIPLGFDLPEPLTERERVLAGWLLTDLSLKVIAETLYVSLNTVKTQVSSIYRKLDVTSRNEAIEKLEATGLVTRADR